MTDCLDNVFEKVSTRKPYTGYMYSIASVLMITFLGSLCGLKTLKEIQAWASNIKISVMLRKHFGIKRVPCYSHYTVLVGFVKPESLNECFIEWAETLKPSDNRNSIIAIDGKTIRSTGNMQCYSSPLHIVSAHLSNLGITLGQLTVDEKSNEIPALRELIKLLHVEGALIVADALHCQKETAEAVLESGADYLFDVKDNQPTLKKEIEQFVETEKINMDTVFSFNKRSDRQEKRTSYVSYNISAIKSAKDWKGATCFGAIRNDVLKNDTLTTEWHYYISSEPLTAADLLRNARLEWGVESMHWLLDVNFREDFCRLNNSNSQENLNMVRKMALNKIRLHKLSSENKLPISNIMFNCLVDFEQLLKLFC